MISFFQISPYILEIAWRAEISGEILAEMISFKKLIKEKYSHQLKDCVSGYHTLTLLYRSPIDKQVICSELQSLYKNIDTQKSPTGTLWKIPVYYNGRDLENFTKSIGLSTEELISLHTGNEYIIHFYGFIPGFLYLGGLNPRLHHPRKDNPERTVPAGSVAIGGKQTGIYPFESPGGWHILGSCPVKMFDPNDEPTIWANEGDRIRFYRVEQQDFDNMKLQGNGLIKDSTYG